MSADDLLAKLDKTQVDLLKEECILLDTDDNKIGKILLHLSTPFSK